MVRSAATLVRERGARGTSIDDVLRHSGAPRGSVYHHFPGGRKQLLREATDHAGRFVSDRLRLTTRYDPLTALDAFVAAYRTQLRETGFRAGCPVAAVAVEAPDDGDEALLDAAAAAFAGWQELLRGHYVAHGADPADADELALTVISAVEGALILCRARRDLVPLDAVHHRMRALLEASL